MSEETLKQNDPVLQAIAALDAKFEKRFEQVEKRFEQVDNQLESIREGIVHNSVAFDRLQSVVYNLRADVKELSEEFRQNQKTLSLK